ncbi:hypothetical protein B0J15DRAFT_194252 [Fusarium solani]|uniref:Uncharacterized protein n=1 Tax=Fusarium solani TaxID=169388 RepID=A0A9P9L329_FUSSL|nr:uncharacterized protein B0J15DRAFT_194252 [Fusarium solani]KAH7273086.1 hypothetical protein B0J15DRAFT_194252 [Fusarium solani]
MSLVPRLPASLGLRRFPYLLLCCFEIWAASVSQSEALPQPSCIKTSRKACRTGAESNRPRYQSGGRQGLQKVGAHSRGIASPVPYQIDGTINRWQSQLVHSYKSFHLSMPRIKDHFKHQSPVLSKETSDQEIVWNYCADEPRHHSQRGHERINRSVASGHRSRRGLYVPASSASSVDINGFQSYPARL